MKANEFVKDFGLDYAYKFLNYNASIAEDRCVLDFGEYHNLKRIVESHELVKSCGGLHSVGEKLTHGMYESRSVIERLKQAITDVESCMGEG